MYVLEKSGNYIKIYDSTISNYPSDLRRLSESNYRLS